MAAKANSTRTSVAHPVSDIDPSTLPEMYSIIVTGPDTEWFTSGEKQVFSRGISTRKGDLVLLWRRPDLVKQPGQQLVFARLKSDIPDGVAFGVQPGPDVDDVIFAETVGGKQQLAYKVVGLLAIHKWLGGVKPGQRVHEFVQQRIDANKEPAVTMQNIPVQQSAPTLLAGIGHNSGPLTMSSREVAELTGSAHDNVLKTVRGLVSRGVVSANETPYVHPQNGQTYPEFLLTYRDTMIVVSGYSPELRAKIVDRWIELEEAMKRSAAPVLPATYLDALKALVASEEAKQIAEQRALTAERTKAEIGSRREATAMNTASQAVKKANKLGVELDRSHSYATIKRMSMLYHGQKFDWRHLKRTSVEMGIPAIDVFDQNYGTVKAYHADVWQEAYALGIPARLDDEAA